MTGLSGGVVSLLNKRRRACLGVECQIVGEAVAYRNRLLKWNTNCLAEAYKLSYIVGSLPLAKNAKHSPSILCTCTCDTCVINPRRACAARVTVVGYVPGLSVYLSVTQHLASRMFIRPTNDTTYLTGNEGQIFVGFSLKMLRCRVRALPV